MLEFDIQGNTIPASITDSGLSESSESAITLVASDSGLLLHNPLQSEPFSTNSNAINSATVQSQITGSSKNQYTSSGGSNGNAAINTTSGGGVIVTNSINSQMYSTLGSNNCGTMLTATGGNTFSGSGGSSSGNTVATNSIGGSISLAEMGHSRNSSNTSQVRRTQSYFILEIDCF